MAVIVTLIGLVLAGFGYAGLILLFKYLNWLPSRYTDARLRIGTALLWVVTVAVVVFVLVIENRSLGSIGIQIGGSGLLDTVVLGFITGVLVVGAVLFVFQYANFLGAPDEVTLLLLAQPPRWKLGIALTAGITEEILFRGYLIERTLELTGNPLVAGVLSVTAFSLAHLPGRRPRHVLPPILALGIGLAVTYLLFRNVIPVALVHMTINGMHLFGNDAEDLLDEMDDATVDDRLLSAIRDE